MVNEFISFGNHERFQVGIKWVPESESVDYRPKHHGWSMGALVFTLAGENLMAHRIQNYFQDRLVWYLGPLLHWLADNWVPLFHEEHFPWPEQSEDAAAAVCTRAIARFASVGPAATGSLNAAEAWYHRHGLASAASGGLFRDIFLRRFADDVELSWTTAPPPFAPEGFTFETEPGFARLPVSDVAEPLWQMLCWVKENPPALDTPAFNADWRALAEKIDSLNNIEPERINAADVAEALLVRVRASFQEKGRDDLLEPEISPSAPYATAEAPAVAMFGGLSVNLSTHDINILRDVLIASTNGGTSLRLRDLIENTPLRDKPWQDGYDLAEDLLDCLEEENFQIAPRGFVDIRSLCGHLDIDISQKEFDTEAIRGVALAGAGFSPSIIVNTRSPYNHNEDGRRFTIAHELCHILHDQSRAQRLAHASGPWASRGIEKRANAFAAWLLMPPRLLQQHVQSNAPMAADRLRTIAGALHVADTALVQHLFNVALISEDERERLRSELWNRPPSSCGADSLQGST